jgi:hypothetical protein
MKQNDFVLTLTVLKKALAVLSFPLDVSIENVSSSPTIADSIAEFCLKATSYNNLGIMYRNQNKLRHAWLFVDKALRLEIHAHELLELHPQTVSHDSKHINMMSSIACTHLNMCAIQSQMKNHKSALLHAECALASLSGQRQRIQQLKRKLYTNANAYQASKECVRQGQMLESSFNACTSLMSICYHNMAVEQEFLKQFHASSISFQQAQLLSRQQLGPENELTQSIDISFNAARSLHPEKIVSNASYWPLQKRRQLSSPLSLNSFKKDGIRGHIQILSKDHQEKARKLTQSNSIAKNDALCNRKCFQLPVHEASSGDVNFDDNSKDNLNNNNVGIQGSDSNAFQNLHSEKQISNHNQLIMDVKLQPIQHRYTEVRKRPTQLKPNSFFVLTNATPALDSKHLSDFINNTAHIAAENSKIPSKLGQFESESILNEVDDDKNEVAIANNFGLHASMRALAENDGCFFQTNDHSSIASNHSKSEKYLLEPRSRIQAVGFKQSLDEVFETCSTSSDNSSINEMNESDIFYYRKLKSMQANLDAKVEGCNDAFEKHPNRIQQRSFSSSALPIYQHKRYSHELRVPTKTHEFIVPNRKVPSSQPAQHLSNARTQQIVSNHVPMHQNILQSSLSNFKKENEKTTANSRNSQILTPNKSLRPSAQYDQKCVKSKRWNDSCVGSYHDRASALQEKEQKRKLELKQKWDSRKRELENKRMEVEHLLQMREQSLIDGYLQKKYETNPIFSAHVSQDNFAYSSGDHSKHSSIREEHSFQFPASW